MLKSYKMKFDGAVLERAFWLYVWDIKAPKAEYLYVGRTGDSSSPRAASPVSRISQHLDFGPKAKGSSIVKRLAEKEIKPSSCSFEMLAIGPLFPEQKLFASHKLFRDKMATLEHRLAHHLRTLGYDVLGTHRLGSELDEEWFEQVLAIIAERFPSKRASCQ